jgi:catechol 2,3-dioxygenase-like lactoylglutathione lyase family enzyme
LAGNGHLLYFLLMLSTAKLVAFAATTDLDRARAFYEDALGLELIEQNPIACVFDANGTQLRVTLVPEKTSAAYTVLGWEVEDIENTVRLLGEQGVEFLRFPQMEQDDFGIWTAPGGGRVAWFSDPDGNTLSVSR